MIGIIGSLIFVGLEIKQSQRFAMAGQQMEKTAITTNRFTAFNEAGLDWHSVAFGNRPRLAGSVATWHSGRKKLFSFNPIYI